MDRNRPVDHSGADLVLPRFYTRIADATVPLLDGVARDELREKLEATEVTLSATDDVASSEALGQGYLFAANLLARIYPTLGFSGRAELCAEAVEVARSINPSVTINEQPDDSALKLAFDRGAPATADEVTVWASGWNVGTDGALDDLAEPAALPAALAAAALGVGEIFRMVFADVLPPPRPRRAAQAGSLNLINLDERETGLPIDLTDVELGRVHLVGAGAIGEAFVETLRHCGASGTLVAVDPQAIELSNMQRYVLAFDADEGASKTGLVARALAGTNIEVEEVEAAWGEDARGRGAVNVAAVGLDTPEDRIGVAASLPGRTYNAFTQPLDLGWSRHEHFGEAPCLACLYWPTTEGPGRHQVIGEALEEPPRRVLAYLGDDFPVGKPLQRRHLGDPDPPTEEEAVAWMSRPLLDDVLERFDRPQAERAKWADLDVEDLYRDGICGGALVSVGGDGRARDVLVPLAHQSALAGVMLAVQVIAAASPALAAARPDQIEGRFDVLRGLSQSPVVPTPRVATCICSDPDFTEQWSGSGAA